MDKNIKIVLQYDGTRYDGWQKQGNTEQTIQGKLESILKKMTGVPIEVHGAGRTDAGVHALAQVANFHVPGAFFKRDENNTEPNMTDAEAVKYYLNHYLPEDIAVLEASEVGERFHSRLNARAKIYVYRIETADKKPVFERKYMYGLSKNLDLQAMKAAARVLTGTHDFKAFSSLKKIKKSTVRTLSDIVIKKEGSRITITYEGDGFLYNMVRILTGTLIEVGLHERTLKDIEAAFHLGERSQAGITAPAEGLFLEKVLY